MKLRSNSQRVLGDTTYIEKHEFSIGVLPTEKDMIELMQYHILPKGKGIEQISIEEAAKILADGVIDHWFFCNIYTINKRHVVRKLIKLYNEFIDLVRTREPRRNEIWLNTIVVPFNFKVKTSLFDIVCIDKSRIKLF